MSPPLRLAAALLTLAAAGCARTIDPRLVSQPIAGRTWVSERHRDHPLAGKIWDGRAGAFVDEAALAGALAAADLVLLGEVHDNPDHHVLQARLVRSLVAGGRRPALALEMLTSDLQPDVDAARARTPRTPDVLADAWKKGGWPDFDLYRPVLAAGLEAGLPLVAANLPRAQVKALVRKGLDSADPALRARLESGPALGAEETAALRAEMMESHCGAMPEAMMDPFILAQRARDATLSARLVEGSAASGAVLVAGNGHVRRGDVPAWLAVDAAGKKIVAVAFVEIEPDERWPGGYADEFGTGPFPYDFAVFTPATEREDPCKKLRERSRAHERKEKDATTPGAPAPPAAPGAAPPAG
jgi:uncharacterized iron-regulated protein